MASKEKKKNNFYSIYRRGEPIPPCPATNPTTGCSETTSYLLYSTVYDQRTHEGSPSRDSSPQTLDPRPELPRRYSESGRYSPIRSLFSKTSPLNIPSTSHRGASEHQPEPEKQTSSNMSSPELYFTPPMTSDPSRESHNVFWQSPTTMYANTQHEKIARESRSRAPVQAAMETSRRPRYKTGFNLRKLSIKVRFQRSRDLYKFTNYVAQNTLSNL